MFPELAVRELVANALIHQDLFVTGAGPMVEIFDDRIEITNPGEPLVDTQRFVDTPLKSRNEGLASLMRRFRICEERGSGIDKVVQQVELFQLPAPLFERPGGVHTGGAVCPQAPVRHGQGGPGAGLLSALMPLLCHPPRDDEHDPAGTVWGRGAQPVRCLPAHS
jgi:hypothetical protein